MPVDGDALGLHVLPALQVDERAPRVLDLLEADHPPARTFTLAAAAHVEAQRDVAERGKELGDDPGSAVVLVTAEAVQHHEGGTALVALHVGREVEDAGEPQRAACELHAFFHRASIN